MRSSKFETGLNLYTPLVFPFNPQQYESQFNEILVLDVLNKNALTNKKAPTIVVGQLGQNSGRSVRT
jgi:hypothetical protein